MRAALIALGAYLVGKGVIDEGAAGAIVSVGLVIAPILWAQFTAWNAHKKQATMAQALPDQIARFK